MTLNGRPFSLLQSVWTDTGERHWWLCLSLAVFFGSFGYASLVDGHAAMTIFNLIACGANVGLLGMKRSR